MATLKLGNGSDGAITVSSNKNINQDTIASSRTYPDAVNYRVTGLSGNTISIAEAPEGIIAGDEVILINIFGIYGGDVTNAGNYETFEVDSVSSGTINFLGTRLKNYGDAGGDSNLATHWVMVQRIPQYTHVTVNGGISLTCDGVGGGNTGGLLCFKAMNTVSVNGTITANGSGGGGGVPGYGVSGGAGGSLGSWLYGAGGAYGTNGGNQDAGSGGTAYGEQEVTHLHVGSGGGHMSDPWGLGGGGAGGGAIFISAGVLTIYTGGTIQCNGNQGGAYGRHAGNGAGGSVLLHVSDIDTQSAVRIYANGHTGGDGGDGGQGRIAVYYRTITDAQTSPTAYEELISLPYYVEGTASEGAEIRVYKVDWEFEASKVTSAGSYEVEVSTEGPFHVIGMPTVSGTSALIYRDVIPTQ